MAIHTNEVIPSFDFGAAMAILPEKRCSICAETVTQRMKAAGLWDLFDIPPVPDSGATDEELAKLESQLGVNLPREYRDFLCGWRYLMISDGRQIWGFDHEGVSIGSPWVSSEHRPDTRYLVFGDYSGYGDGDQLLFDIDDPGQTVVAYLHEHGPLYETFAPSFSLALWRMVHENA